MNLLIVLLIAAIFGLGACAIFAIEAQKSQKSHRAATAIGMICFILAFALIVTIVPTHHRVVDGAEHVAVFYTQEAKGKKANDMFYDASSDEYFIVGYNKWNPFDLSYRIMIDNEDAKKYVKAYGELQVADIKKDG